MAAGLLPIGVLGELVSIGTLMAFIVVCIGVVVLRYTRPELPRPFRVKGVWPVAILGVVFCGAMVAGIAGRYLVAVDHLDGDWVRLLLRLWVQAQQAASFRATRSEAFQRRVTDELKRPSNPPGD